MQFHQEVSVDPHNESIALQDLGQQGHLTFQLQLQYLVRQLSPWALPTLEDQTYKHQFATPLKHFLDREFYG
jgi:hypothetical protein